MGRLVLPGVILLMDMGVLMDGLVGLARMVWWDRPGFGVMGSSSNSSMDRILAWGLCYIYIPSTIIVNIILCISGSNTMFYRCDSWMRL